jgi:protein SCO1
MGSMKRVSLWACVPALLTAASCPIWAQDTLHQELAPIAPFTLTDPDGKEFSSEKLLGKVWVAHFFYVACKECNQTTPVMSELQKRIQGKPDLLIVSISLNDDSPADLKRFAQDWGAVPGQWLFLTGPKKVVKEISEKSFALGLDEPPGAAADSVIAHDSKVVVVDRQGVFQGYIDRKDPSAVDRLVPRMRELASSRYTLSAFNAVLNFSCAVLLVLGYIAIRGRLILLHKACMLTALTTSAVFLASYLYYHFVVLAGQPPRFPGVGPVWYVYIAILLSHTILAVIVAPLALTVTYLGLRNNLSRHVRLARWTLPIWLYVSVTGVVVYWMLYQLYPPF